MSHTSELEAQDSSTDDAALLTTGEMARRSSNTLRTVRFYEEEGILHPVRRTDGGHRLFDRRELERLMLVTDMRAAGLSLDEIKSILDVKQRSGVACEAAKQATVILNQHIQELRDKLAVLTRLQEDLGRTSDVMTACLDCHDTRFPIQCDSCSVMSGPSVPRSMRVLWSASATTGPQSAPNSVPVQPAPGTRSGGSTHT